MAHFVKVRHYYVNLVMAHLYKVRHYYVYDWVKPWSNLVMAHFSPGAPLLFWLLMAHLHMVRHYYLVMAHHMYSAPLVSILAIAVFLVVV
jgi:hypothetical protein